MIDIRTSKLFRGIAILMVIGSHYAAAMFVEPMRPMAKEVISKLGIYGVDIFFLLSGYGLVKSAKKNGINKAFVLKRFVNTYIPYILIVGFFAIVDKSITSTRALVNLLIGYDYWFMCVIFVFYTAFMIIYKIGKCEEIVITVAVIGYCIALFNMGKADFWILSNGAFLIGIYAASLENKFGSKIELGIRKVNLTAIGLGLTVIGAFLYTSNGELWAHIFTSMSFTIAVLGICVESYGGGAMLPSVGRYSLYVYLLHLRLFWKFVMYNEQWNYAGRAIFAAILTLVISIAIGYAIEWNLNWMVDKILKTEKSS